MIIFRRLVWSGFSERTDERVEITLDPGEGMPEALRCLAENRPFDWREFWIDDPVQQAELQQVTAAFDRERTARREAAIAKAKATMAMRQVSAWPMEKQRSSRIDWLSMVPYAVAQKQMAWERCRTAARLLGVGVSAGVGAEFFGISDRRFRDLARRYSPISPAERYWRESV